MPSSVGTLLRVEIGTIEIDHIVVLHFSDDVVLEHVVWHVLTSAHGDEFINVRRVRYLLTFVKQPFLHW